MLSRVVALTGLVLCSLTANAAVVDLGDWMLDTNSGHEWLKLTNTANIGYNDVQLELATGQTWEGGFVANFIQLNNFLIQLDQSQLDAYTNGAAISYAFFANGADLGCIAPGTEATYVCAAELPLTPGVAINWTDGFADLAYSFAGTAIKRPSAVPVPGAIYLFMSALVGVVVRKRWS